MSIIQNIRERAAWLIFGLIALSLIGFLLMDAFVGKSRFFGNRSTVVGSVNGQNIEEIDFNKRVSDMEDGYKAQGMEINESMQQSIRDQVWNKMVEETLFSKDIQTLGLDVTDKEVSDMLVGPDRKSVV